MTLVLLVQHCRGELYPGLSGLVYMAHGSQHHAIDFKVFERLGMRKLLLLTDRVEMDERTLQSTITKIRRL